MGLFDRFRNQPKPPQNDKRAMAEYILKEARCPYCASEFRTVEQVNVAYNFPDGRIAQIQKARARCDKDNLDIFAISPGGRGDTFFVRRAEYDFFQSDGTKTNPDVFSQYMESIPLRSPIEALYEMLIGRGS